MHENFKTLTKFHFRLEATAREYDKMIEAVNRDRKFQQVIFFPFVAVNCQLLYVEFACMEIEMENEFNFIHSILFPPNQDEMEGNED